jgi:hypothetical protein
MARRWFLIALAMIGWVTPLQTHALPALRILGPLDGAVVEDDEVDVHGHWTADSPNVVVTVNGVRALVFGNRFLLTGMRLSPGVNELTIKVSDGTGVATRTSKVWSAGPASVKLSATPSQGFAPLKVDFAVRDSGNRQVTRIELDADGNGEIDSYVVWAPDVTHTYAQPGAFQARMTAIFEDGTTHQFRKWIGTVDPTAVDVALKASWAAFTQALAEGDKAGALSWLTGRAKAKYELVIDALMPGMPSFVASLSQIQTLSLENGIAEYLVSRALDGSTRWFFVHFLQDADGYWRLEDM